MIRCERPSTSSRSELTTITAFLACEITDDIVDCSAGAHVDATGRFVQDDDLRLPRDAPGDHDLLLVAAGELACSLIASEAIARMRKHDRGGRLINTASGQARQGFIFTPHYAASKFGVVGITQSLAKEVAKEGITVNAICPGIIETDMWVYNDEAWGKVLGTYKPGELMAEWVRNIPMGRAGTGEDVAGLVTFLASTDAAYITGQTINVDGDLIMS
jgi:NAD(P)-dependent dehydrogenase (short-subunit alcohol dehydrogenase family)